MDEPVIAFIGRKDGNGVPLEYHMHIPAKDLSTADYDALDNDQRALVRASALYDYAAYRDALKQRRDASEATAPEEPAAETPASEAAETPAPEAEFAVPSPEAAAPPTPEGEAGA